MTSTEAKINVRDHLAVALDVTSIKEAAALVTAVQPHVGVAKIGLELFTIAGRDAVTMALDAELSVFLDLKLHDIPNTVERAAHAIAQMGVSYFTVHTLGGEPMLAAAVRGARNGAEAMGFPSPITLAVTVLTSDTDAPEDALRTRILAARNAGCTGLVCAAPDLAVVRPLAPSMTIVTPGIRMPGDDPGDQARIATPASAIADGADLLVIGRSITGASDPAAAAERIADSIRDSLT